MKESAKGQSTRTEEEWEELRDNLKHVQAECLEASRQASFHRNKIEILQRNLDDAKREAEEKELLSKAPNVTTSKPVNDDEVENISGVLTEGSEEVRVANPQDGGTKETEMEIDESDLDLNSAIDAPSKRKISI